MKDVSVSQPAGLRPAPWRSDGEAKSSAAIITSSTTCPATCNRSQTAGTAPARRGPFDLLGPDFGQTSAASTTSVSVFDHIADPATMSNPTEASSITARTGCTVAVD